MSRMKNVMTGDAFLAADCHCHFGVKALAVCPNRHNVNAPAHQRPLASVKVTIDAVLLAGAGGGRKKAPPMVFVPNIFSRGCPNVCSAALLNSVITPAWLIVTIGSSDDSRIALLRGLGLGKGRAIFVLAGLAMDESQTRGPAPVVRADSKDLSLYVDQIIAKKIAQTALAQTNGRPC